MSTTHRHVCVFRVGPHLLCLPIEHVQEVHETVDHMPVPLTPTTIRGLMNLRGHVVTTVDTRLLLGLPEYPPTARTHIVALFGRRTLALLVDEVEGVAEIPHDTVGPAPRTLPAPLSEVAPWLVERKSDLVLLVDVDALFDLVVRRAA